MTSDIHASTHLNITSQMLRGMTILLVDDEKFSRTTVARMLNSLGCLDVLYAENGEEALQVLSAGNSDVDVIISDFNMPISHGLQLLRAVRTGSNNIKRATPFAMLTGYSDKRLVDLALALDVNAFLVKPVSKDGLEKRLGKLLKQVKSDSWLKETYSYTAMDVDGILEEISKPESEQKTSRGLELLPKQQPLFRNSKIPQNVKPVKKQEKTGPVEVKGLPEEPEKVVGVEARGLPDPSEATPQADQAPEVLGGAAPASARPQLEGELCPINQLPEGAVLARDVFTADGRLFIHAATELTPRIVSILGDLHELGHPVESIWIATEEAPSE
ncbi:MAG: response regulator [Rhodospirillaceae bacterium]|jgi:CheY-like chemotaxis protein|nr:response regulator [Rhodospirillaceae bacterium]MBT5242710.1 response regulator [Rhodospirillaceae bacterium]MBT5561523.1 response regulator [Rhodospirillaceae bacterium]MBT6241879.1 response regulator [Rhodospirillaceae bacterium]MBT7138680.1 response regulator [Rhodospirillaceae bacterium]